MKKLGIDARLYFQTGVGTYLRNLLFYLDNLNKNDIEITAVVMDQDKDVLKKAFSTIKIASSSARWHTFAEQTRFLTDLNMHKFDLMHFAYFSYPYFYSRPFLSTIHDLTPLLFKTGKASTQTALQYEIKYNAFRLLLQHQVKKSIKIITPTKTVKNEIIAYFGNTYKEKIEYVYEGMDSALTEVSEDSTILKKIPAKEYLLYVGNFYPHKNVETLIQAFTAVSDACLVLVGPKDHFAQRMQNLITQLQLNNSIVMLHDVNKEQLKALYKGARSLIHPSLSEGFGLPLIEAQSLNVPILASDIPVFKELLGESYVSFDPRNKTDIAEKITGFLEKKLSSNGTSPHSFSFEQMSIRHLEIYKELLS